MAANPWPSSFTQVLKFPVSSRNRLRDLVARTQGEIVTIKYVSFEPKYYCSYIPL
jgi:hypothetical protein